MITSDTDLSNLSEQQLQLSTSTGINNLTPELLVHILEHNYTQLKATNTTRAARFLAKFPVEECNEDAVLSLLAYYMTHQEFKKLFLVNNQFKEVTMLILSRKKLKFYTYHSMMHFGLMVHDLYGHMLELLDTKRVLIYYDEYVVDCGSVRVRSVPATLEPHHRLCKRAFEKTREYIKSLTPSSEPFLELLDMKMSDGTNIWGYYR